MLLSRLNTRLFALFAVALMLSLCVSPLFAGVNALAAEAAEAAETAEAPGAASESSGSDLTQTATPQAPDQTYMDLLRDSGIISSSDAQLLQFAAGRRRIEPDNYMDDLYFDTWSVLMQVHRNRSIDITENFDVYFNEEMHGMTRTLPAYSSAEAFEIWNMEVVGDPYHYDEDTIYIGSANRTVSGFQHYTIKYTIANFDDSYDGYDRLYRDIVGSEVSYPVYNVCGAIVLDEGMTFDDVAIYSGRYGYTENEYIESLSSANRLLVYNTKELGSYNAVTVDAKLPEGAYSEPALLQPDYIVDNMVINASIDKYGLMHVDEEYDISILSSYAASFTRSLPVYGDVESKVKKLTLTKDGGKPETSKNSYISCTLDPADGTQAHITVSYDMQYLIRTDKSDSPLEFAVITYNGTRCKYKNVEIDLDTPFDLDSQLQYFGVYTGDYSSLSSYSESVYDAKYYFSDDIGGHSIKSVLSGSDMPIGEIATMETAFVKDALQRKTLATDYILSILGLGGIGALIASLFVKKSSEKQLTPSVQYYPPAGLNPAEVGYIIDNECENRDVTSLIYYWASKGFLTIEVPKKGSGFTLHKLKPLSSDFRDYEKDLFNKIFRLGDGDTVKSSQLTNKMYSDVSTAVSKVQNVFTGSQRFFTSNSSTLAGLLPVAVPALVWLGALAAARLWGSNDGASTSLALGGIISYFAARSTKKSLIRKHKDGAGTSIFRIIGKWALLGLAFLAMFACGGGSVSYITGSILGALVLANTLIAPRLLKRTDFYTDLLGLVVGFKEFLTTAEKERLKMLLDENPSYYYDILPYAQVLGVSKQWLSRFDGLTMQSPAWFYGPAVTPYTLNTMLNTNMTRMNNSMTSVPSSSGSSGGGFSGGSFGGGFSGGGGGFSGGGGGGGAGGW